MRQGPMKKFIKELSKTFDLYREGGGQCGRKKEQEPEIAFRGGGLESRGRLQINRRNKLQLTKCDT